MALCTVTTTETLDSSLVKLRVPFHSDPKDVSYCSRVILAVDQSGSMSGSPWKQVQSAIQAIYEMSKKAARDNSLDPILITYNNQVCTRDLASIARTTANGLTDFVKAFQQIQKTVKEIPKQLRVVIIFMTDGHDTCNSKQAIQSAQATLSSFLRESHPNCVVHAIGYSSDHDLNMMNLLKSLGSTEGVYRYAEGSMGLDEKFCELFEFADATVDLSVKLPDVKEPITITGERIDAETIEAEFWLSLNRKTEKPLEISVGKCHYHVVPVWTEPDIIFELKLLSKRANEVKTQSQLDSIQKELQQINVFKISGGETKVNRQAVMELRNEIQTRLDAMHAIMAAMARGALNETAALAKMNDLRYAEKFSKSARQRRMDQRAVRNQANLKSIDAKLKALQFNPDTAFADVDLVTFTCCLTLNNCRDMMVDSIDDIMGVGLIIERQEHVVDAPTLVSVKHVSVTILSRSACDDAIKMKMNIVDAAQLHGGFVPSKSSGPETSSNIHRNPLQNRPSEFTRGVAAEPINAFLPLYICDAHFERVQVMLEPMLGYLFTLDITGYQSDQLLGLYSILGQMMNANPLNASEREEIILHEFTRLCRGLIPRTLQYLGDENDILKKFMASPAGRSKAHIQNLMTLFGYMLALGIKTVDEPLRYAIVEEIYRRHFAYIYHGTADNVIDAHVQALLYDVDDHNQDNNIENQTSVVNELSCVRTKNNRRNDSRFGMYARSVLKTSESNIPVPKEDIEIVYNMPERSISSMNNKIRAKMTELLSSFSIKPFQNVLHRLGIRLMDITNEHECVMLRSMLVQCLRFYSNESINSAMLNKTFFNVYTDYQQVLNVAHQEFVSVSEKLAANKMEQIRVFEIARRIVLTNDIGVFLGRMMVYAPTRGGKVFDNVISLLIDRGNKQVPLLAEKISVIFTGRYKEHQEAEKEFHVLSNGVPWFPDRSIINRVREALGEERWNDLDRTMQGRTCGHVYRLSDIPNRHGYCNSHPNPKLVVMWSS